jgi:hypothetical protein
MNRTVRYSYRQYHLAVIYCFLHGAASQALGSESLNSAPDGDDLNKKVDNYASAWRFSAKPHLVCKASINSYTFLGGTLALVYTMSPHDQIAACARSMPDCYQIPGVWALGLRVERAITGLDGDLSILQLTCHVACTKEDTIL